MSKPIQAIAAVNGLQGLSDGLFQSRFNDSLRRERKGGRKPALNAEQIEQARAAMDNPKLKIKSIIKTLGVSKATLYKYVPTGKPVTENKR